MTRTKKTGMKARGGRVAVIGALGLASVALAAGPAFAKAVGPVSSGRAVWFPAAGIL
ncbi:hypothetical protein [Streptomyces sp. NPDC058773]|uniref:hypothetical protein n=1 Tax=Streptomyces sp. NPDC058773 TaxID=3346632 RepID=UPI00369D91C9